MGVGVKRRDKDALPGPRLLAVFDGGARGYVIDHNPVVAAASVAAFILGQIFGLVRPSVYLAVVDLVAEQSPVVLVLIGDHALVVVKVEHQDAGTHTCDGDIQLVATADSLVSIGGKRDIGRVGRFHLGLLNHHLYLGPAKS